MTLKNNFENRIVLVVGWASIPILIAAYFSLPQYIGPWYLLSKFTGGPYYADLIWMILGLAILLMSGVLGYSLLHRRFSIRFRFVVGAFAFVLLGLWLAAFVTVQGLPADMPRPIYW
ncbi:hypothetical protein [Parasphingorhabdus sp.]|uniref:hypothetical protein n=1 Tax=Parasphingorhabdus sp. TaxID=2709688 RepID=UPI002B270EB0|nr:hypothetical protein [Parasphingorhabdus sp.]